MLRFLGVFFTFLSISFLANPAFAASAAKRNCAAEAAAASDPSFGRSPLSATVPNQSDFRQAAFVKLAADETLLVGGLQDDDQDVHFYGKPVEGILPYVSGANTGSDYYPDVVLAAKGSPYFLTLAGYTASVFDARDRAKQPLLSEWGVQPTALALDGGKFLLVGDRSFSVIETGAEHEVVFFKKASRLVQATLYSVAVTQYDGKYLVAMSFDSGLVRVASLSKDPKGNWKLQLLVDKRLDAQNLPSRLAKKDSSVWAAGVTWLSRREVRNAEPPPILVAAVQAETFPRSGDDEITYPGTLVAWKLNVHSDPCVLSDYAPNFRIGNNIVRNLISPHHSDHVIVSTDSPASLVASLKLVDRGGGKGRFEKVWLEQLPRHKDIPYKNENSGPYDPILSVIASPDGKWAAIGSEGGILVRRPVDSMEDRGQTPLGAMDVRALTFTEDSRFLAAGAKSGALKVFEVAPKKQTEDLPRGRPIRPGPVDTGRL